MELINQGAKLTTAMTKLPVLVTGGAGYIGSHEVLALTEAGWPVAVLDDLSNGSRDLVAAGVPFYEGSIADCDLLRRIFNEQGTQAIMHFAASAVVPESVEKPLDYYANNTVATHSMICAAVTSGVRHILFSSTAAVYGVLQRAPVEEDDPKEPINPYGASKLMTERMLADCALAYSFNYGALRYFNVAGADPNGRLGQMGKGSTHLIKIAVEAAVGKRDHVNIFGDDYPTPDGTCIRDYIHVSDLADVHVLALHHLIERANASFVMNCGYGKGLSVIEVLDALDHEIEQPIRRQLKPRRTGDPPTLVASTRRLVETLKWTPRYDEIGTILRHALAWERKLQELPIN